MGSATGIAGVELNVIMQMLLHFMMAMLRIGAFAVAAPIFGARYVPLQVRIIAVVALTVPIWDRVPMPEFNALIEITIIITILQELIIGLAAGLILSIIFSAAAKAGDQIATSAGLGFASQIDPVSGTQTPVISQLFSLMFLVIFLSLDGHLVDGVDTPAERHHNVPDSVKVTLSNQKLGGVSTWQTLASSALI